MDWERTDRKRLDRKRLDRQRIDRAGKMDQRKRRRSAGTEVIYRTGSCAGRGGDESGRNRAGCAGTLGYAQGLRAGVESPPGRNRWIMYILLKRKRREG